MRGRDEVEDYLTPSVPASGAPACKEAVVIPLGSNYRGTLKQPGDTSFILTRVKEQVLSKSGFPSYGKRETKFDGRCIVNVVISFLEGSANLECPKTNVPK